MDIGSIGSFVELHNAVSSRCGNGRWIYRGHAKSDWPLIPKKGRDQYSGSDEKEILQKWKEFSRFYIPSNISSNWEWLAIAQHHGVPTRLLDWSDNPLVACFFALSEERYINDDGALYAYRLSDRDPVKPDEEKSPFNDEGVRFFEPASLILRIIRQRGVFTVHGPANKDLVDIAANSLAKIVIKSASKATIFKDLERYHINHMHCFPDLDGVGRYIEWIAREKSKRPEDRKYDLEFSESSNRATIMSTSLSGAVAPSFATGLGSPYIDVIAGQGHWIRPSGQPPEK